MSKKINNAIALLTRKPNIEWLHFLSTFTNYDVYVIIDESPNVENYDKIYGHQFPGIELIQISKNDCCGKGFMDSSTATKLPRIIAWDKALYFFSIHCRNYDNVWFMEEDVFIHSESTLIELDREFPKEDLLTKNHNIKNNDDVLDWHWKHVNGYIKLPWACSLVPICRLSNLLIEKIRLHAKKAGCLFFIEAMFNTIAEQNNMLIGGRVPGGNGHMEKFKFIDHMGDGERFVDEKHKQYLFHPIKDVSRHEIIRKRLASKNKPPTQTVPSTSLLVRTKMLICNPNVCLTYNSATIVIL